MPTSIQSGKKPMECRKMRDCRPKLTTAKWRDNEPVSAAFTSESHLTFIKIKKTPDMNNDSGRCMGASRMGDAEHSA
jgi:hypothetical protein